MRLKYSVPLVAIAFMMVVTMLVGSSYAYWKVTKYQTKENVIHTGCFELSFSEETSSINLNNAYPITDDKGLKTTPYTFTLTNTCEIDATYTVYLNTLRAKSGQIKLDDKYIKYSLKQRNSSVAVANPLPTLSSATENTEDLTNFTFESGDVLDKSYELATGSLKGRSSAEANDGASVTYDLRLWMDEDVELKDEKGSVPGRTFEAALSTIAYATKLD